MTDENELEDSLRVCHEIEEFLKYRNMAEKNHIRSDGVFNNQTLREVDKILSGTEPTREAEPEAVAEPVREPEPETVAEPVREPVPEAPVEPVRVYTPEAVAEPVRVYTPEAVAEPVREPEPEIIPEPEEKTVTEAGLEPAADTKPEKMSAMAWLEDVVPAGMEDRPAEKASGDEHIHIVKMNVDRRPTTKKKDMEEEYIEPHPFLHTLLNVLICITVALVLSLVITKLVAHHTSVEGSSMEDTLENGDQLIVEKMSYYFHDPERYDVIVFPFTENVSYIKRIIGLPGETVQIINGYVYINGQEIDEHYGKEVIEDPGMAAEEIVLGADEYFVLGDNRNASVDSRKEEVGLIHRSDIEGKAWVRFYPFDSITTIE